MVDHVTPSLDVMIAFVLLFEIFDTAKNRPSSGDHVMPHHSFVVLVVRAVQFMPFGDVITRSVFDNPLVATAAKRFNCGDQATCLQSLPVLPAAVRVVHVMPSGEVMTDALLPTATNRYSCGAQHTSFHILEAETVRDVQVIPSGDVIARFVLFATAQKIPSSGAQQTPRHSLCVAAVRDIQEMPSVDVITREAPVPETATKSPSEGAQHTLLKALSMSGAVRGVQLMPSGDVRTRY